MQQPQITEKKVQVMVWHGASSGAISRQHHLLRINNHTRAACNSMIKIGPNWKIETIDPNEYSSRICRACYRNSLADWSNPEFLLIS